MWYYEKKLQYPVKVSTCNPMLAKFLIEQYGGADGELAAALRYMNQRYTIPDKVVGLLTDIATEEFSHLEMIATMIYKLTKDATPEMLKEAGLGDHYVNHDRALFYQNASGVPFTATYIQAKGDPIADLDIRAKYNVSVIAIVREGEIIISPSPEQIIEKEDLLVMIGHRKDLTLFSNIQ